MNVNVEMGSSSTQPTSGAVVSAQRNPSIQATEHQTTRRNFCTFFRTLWRALTRVFRVNRHRSRDGELPVITTLIHVNSNLFLVLYLISTPNWLLTWSAQVCLVRSSCWSSLTCCCVLFRTSLWSGRNIRSRSRWLCLSSSKSIGWPKGTLLFSSVNFESWQCLKIVNDHVHKKGSVYLRLRFIFFLF